MAAFPGPLLLRPGKVLRTLVGLRCARERPIRVPGPSKGRQASGPRGVPALGAGTASGADTFYS